MRLTYHFHVFTHICRLTSDLQQYHHYYILRRYECLKTLTLTESVFSVSYIDNSTVIAGAWKRSPLVMNIHTGDVLAVAEVHTSPILAIINMYAR